MLDREGANPRSLELLQVVLFKKILNLNLYILLLVMYLIIFVREQKGKERISSNPTYILLLILI